MNFIIDTQHINSVCEEVPEDKKMRADIQKRLEESMRGNGMIFVTGNMIGSKHRVIGIRGVTGALFNPVIVHGSNETFLMETAVSLPFRISGKVKRHANIRVRASDLDGNVLTVVYSGLTAKTVQQAIDLLDGKDCWKLMSKEKIDIVKRKLAKKTRKVVNAISN